jgi:predicted nuclease with TOPRIM domain
MKTLDQLVAELEQMQETIHQEESQVRQVKMSDEYKAIQESIDSMDATKATLVQEQAKLVDAVSSSASKFQSLKLTIIELMKIEDRYTIGNVKPKYSTKKAVNNERLLHVMGGDLKKFFKFVKTPQKTVKDHAKTLAPDDKKLFESCIEVVSQELTDVVVSFPD